MSDSEGKQIASLYAKIGFLIDSQEFNRIREALNQTKAEMQDMIDITAEWAKELSNVSLSAGISPKAIQGLRLFAMEAGVAEDAIDNLAIRSREFARRAYFGNGNEYARWRLFFDRFETASSAFENILKAVSSFSPNSNEVRQLLDELGVDYETLIRLSEQYKKYGFNSSFDFLKIDDKNIERMREARIIQETLVKSWDAFYLKIYATQAENIYWYENKLKEISKWLQKSFLGIYNIDIVEKSFGKFVRYFPAIVSGLNHIEGIYNTLGKTFTTLKKTGTIGLSVALLATGSTLVSKILKSLGYINNDFLNILQNKFNYFLENTGTFGLRVQEIIYQGVDYLEDILRDVLPDVLLNTDTFKNFFKTAKDPNGGIILAIGNLADKIIDKIITWLSALWNIVSQFIVTLFNKVMYELAIFFTELYAKIANKSMWLGDVSKEELEQDKRYYAYKFNQPYEDKAYNVVQQIAKEEGYESAGDFLLTPLPERVKRAQADRKKILDMANYPINPIEKHLDKIYQSARTSTNTFNYYNNGKDSNDAHEDFIKRIKKELPEIDTSKYILDTELASIYGIFGGGF